MYINQDLTDAEEWHKSYSVHLDRVQGVQQSYSFSRPSDKPLTTGNTDVSMWNYGYNHAPHHELSAQVDAKDMPGTRSAV